MVVLRQRMIPEERLRVIGMIQAGSTHRQVAITLNRDRRIIDRLWDEYIQTGTTTDRPRTSRPRVTSARDDQYIVNCTLRQRSLNSKRLCELFRAGTNINVSDQTIRNRLLAGNLRSRRPVVRQPLTRQQRVARCQWALVHRRWTRAQWLWLCLVTSPGTTLTIMTAEYRYGDVPVRDMPRPVLPYMAGGMVAQ